MLVFFLSFMPWVCYQDKCLLFFNSLFTFCQVLKKELSCLGTLAREGKACNEHISNSFLGVCTVTTKKSEYYYFNCYNNIVPKNKKLFKCISFFSLSSKSFLFLKGLAVSMPSGIVVQISKELYWLAVWIYRLIYFSTMANVDAALIRQELGQHVWSGKGWARHYPHNPNQKERTHQSIMENVSQAITCSKSHVFFLMNWTEKLHRKNLLMFQKSTKLTTGAKTNK